jgi:hypothetical protein
VDWVIGTVIVVVFLAIAWNRHATKKRREYLFAKYANDVVVQAIMDRKIWQGMTAEQLVDSWGTPVAIDDKVYKTKVVHTYKYIQAGRNRYRSRVKIENGYVVGWEQK